MYLIGIPLVFHGEHDLEARKRAGHAAVFAVLGGQTHAPIIRVDVYAGGIALQQACGHVLCLRSGDAPTLPLCGGVWDRDEVPQSPPLVGGERLPLDFRSARDLRVQ